MLVDFTCVRIQTELAHFEKSNEIPKDLINGVWTVDDIEHCIDTDCFNAHQLLLANELIATYEEFAIRNLNIIKKNLRKDYKKTVDGLMTTHKDFIFLAVMNRYRTEINPVKALYYDTRELIRYYNPDDERKVWLLHLLQDKEFIDKLQDALEHDITILLQLINKYYWPITRLDKSLSLELFHARQMAKEFDRFAITFRSLQYWNPE